MEEENIIKKHILRKLVRANILGGKHTPLDFVKKGIPDHYQNTHKGRKIVEKVVKELVNDEWIIVVAKKTGKGSDHHVALNSRKVSEIKQYVMQEEVV